MPPILALLLFTAVPPDPVAARVGGRVILASEVESRARAAGVDAALALDDLVGEVLLADAARREGLKLPKGDADRVEAERRSLAARRLLEKEAHAGAAPTEAQVLEALHAQHDRARISLLVKATAEEARAALDRIRAGGSFEEQARTSSEEVSRGRSGALGWMTLGSMSPALARAAASAPIGQVAGPAPVEGGFALLLVHERQAADEISLAPMKGEVRSQLEGEAREAASRRYLDELRRRKGAKVDSAFLATTGERLDASRTQRERTVASAGKVKVRYGELVAALGAGGAPHRATSAPPEMKERLAWSLLDRALLEQAALAAGLAKDPEVAAAVGRVERASLAATYAARLKGGVTPPTDEELEARYRDRAKDLQFAAGRPCWRLLAASEDDARRLRGRIQAGETFDQVARESLDRASAARGGFVGAVPDAEIERLRAREPALGAALSSAAPGALSQPIQTRGGWEVFRCDAPVPARQKSFAEAKHMLAMELQAQREIQAVRAKVAELRAGVQVSVDEEVVGRLKARR